MEERTKLAPGPQDTDGGTDYEYGAHDFGDEPINTARITASTGDTGGLEAARKSLGIEQPTNPAKGN